MGCVVRKVDDGQLAAGAGSKERWILIACSVGHAELRLLLLGVSGTGRFDEALPLRHFCFDLLGESARAQRVGLDAGRNQLGLKLRPLSYLQERRIQFLDEGVGHVVACQRAAPGRGVSSFSVQ